MTLCGLAQDTAEYEKYRDIASRIMSHVKVTELTPLVARLIGDLYAYSDYSRAEVGGSFPCTRVCSCVPVPLCLCARMHVCLCACECLCVDGVLLPLCLTEPCVCVCCVWTDLVRQSHAAAGVAARARHRAIGPVAVPGEAVACPHRMLRVHVFVRSCVWLCVFLSACVCRCVFLSARVCVSPGCGDGVCGPTPAGTCV